MGSGPEARHRAICGSSPDTVLPGGCCVHHPGVIQNAGSGKLFLRHPPPCAFRANRVFQSKITYLLKRPVGRPPKGVKRMYGGFEYQAASWAKPRRVVAKVEWHPGALFPRVGFVVTNCRWSLTGSSASTISAARQSSTLLRMQAGD